MFYGSRFYDPLLSRWASPDSIIPQNQGTLAWDRYSYVNNSPLNYTDPTGHMYDDGCSTEGCSSGNDNDSEPSQVNPPNQIPQQTPQPTLPPRGLVIPDNNSTLPNYSVWPPEGFYIAGYEDTINWDSVDWLHLVTNGAGVVGDIATVLSILGIVPAAPVAIFGQITDIAGIAIDMYDLYSENNFSDLSWDLVGSIAKDSKAGRLVPFIGFMLNVNGVNDALNEGVISVPLLKPIPVIVPSNP